MATVAGGGGTAAAGVGCESGEPIFANPLYNAMNLGYGTVLLVSGSLACGLVDYRLTK